MTRRSLFVLILVSVGMGGCVTRRSALPINPNWHWTQSEDICESSDLISPGIRAIVKFTWLARNEDGLCHLEDLLQELRVPDSDIFEFTGVIPSSIKVTPYSGMEKR